MKVIFEFNIKIYKIYQNYIKRRWKLFLQTCVIIIIDKPSSRRHETSLSISNQSWPLIPRKGRYPFRNLAVLNHVKDPPNLFPSRIGSGHGRAGGEPKEQFSGLRLPPPGATGGWLHPPTTNTNYAATFTVHIARRGI